ncbi:ATP-binding protein [Krasilnikovia sp. MM14-A1259]|uniref:ATP-binding protein n=1 Tax=Krasilnikovia sp. MM14-A1259 TaxID=3373539 RepID=UPI00382E7E6E
MRSRRRLWGRTGPVTVGGLMNRAFTVLIVIVLVTGLAGLLSSAPAFLVISGPLTRVIEASGAQAAVRAVLTQAQTGLDGYLLTGADTYRALYEQAKRQYPGAMEDLRSAAADVVARQVDELDAQATRWWAMADPHIPGTPGSPPSDQEIIAIHEQFARETAASRAINAALAARVAQINRTNDVMNAVSLVMLITTIAVGLILGVRIGRSTTRRITAPLAQVLDVLDRLGRGDHDTRVRLDAAPVEVGTVAAALNANADAAATERAMLRSFQLHSAAVRQHLSRAHAVVAAVQAAGELVDADHAVIRMVPDEGGPSGPHVWSAPNAVGDPAPLAATPAEWLAAGPATAFVAEPDGGPRPPEAEVAALRMAEAGPVISVAFGEGSEPVGHLTVIRRQGRAAWHPYEVHLVCMLAADLGRILTQARLFEHANELVTRLQEVDAAKTEFLSTVSHELRTPLTSVSGYLEVIIDQEAGPLTSIQDRMLEVIDRNVGRLRRLIEDLLIMSRIEAGRLVLNREPIDLGAVIESVSQVVEPTAHKTGVTVTHEISEPIMINGDMSHLERAIINLVSNAVKFTGDGGTVTVTARTEGPEAVIVVRDTGIGIPAADLPYLFTRFFRASNATRQAIPGTGLGLAIVSTIVEGHGGTITVDSREGVGTTMTIRIPLSEAPAATAATANTVGAS